MFLNALMLLGVGAAVVPWVLHLLSRSRYTNVDWGAMMFLQPADGDARQSRRMSQFLLLFLRMGVVALLAVALARPALSDSLPAPATGQAVTAVIVLDCSAGMNVEENGHSRMVLARGAAKQVLGRHKGDRVSLVLMGRNQTRAERQPTADLWDAARRIESAETGPGAADVAQSLKAALETLAPHDETGGRGPAVAAGPRPFVDFYVITGGQASGWRDLNSGFRDEFRLRLRQAGITCRLYFVPVGGAEAGDAVVQSITLLNPPAVVNQRADFEVKVRNYADVRWAGLPLTVTTAGPERAAGRGDRVRTKVAEQIVNLAPGATAAFRATATFRSAGIHIVSATLKPGAGAPEDRFDSAIEVREPTRVLVVSGEGTDADPPAAGENAATAPRASGRGAGGAECLQLALAPFKAGGQPGADACSVDAVSADAWVGSGVLLPNSPRRTPESAEQPATPQPAEPTEPTEREVKLADYPVLILSDVERLTPRQALALEQFVYDGGGVLVAPGPLSRPADYNGALYRDGAGILPAALGEPTGADGSELTALSGLDLIHPVFRFLANRPESALSVSVGRYSPVTSRSAGAHVLAQYASGDPFLIEGSAGKGRVLLMTTSLGADWTNLPLSSFYLPFVQSAVRYLANASTLKLNLHPGEPIEAPLEESAAAGAVTVTTPDGDQRPAELLHSGEQAVAHFADTEAPGVYSLRVADAAKPYALAFVVRPSTEDLDPSPLAKEQWAWLTREMGFEKLDPAEHPLDATAASDSGRRELWRWAMGGVLLLAVAEMAVARATSREAE